MSKAKVEKQNVVKQKAESNALFVKSKVRAFIKEQGCNSSRDIIDGEFLNDELKSILIKACNRSKANGRKTLLAKDL